MGRDGWRLEYRRPVKRSVETDQERADENWKEGSDRTEGKRDWTQQMFSELTQPIEFADKGRELVRNH